MYRYIRGRINGINHIRTCLILRLIIMAVISAVIESCQLQRPHAFASNYDGSQEIKRDLIPHPPFSLLAAVILRKNAFGLDKNLDIC